MDRGGSVGLLDDIGKIKADEEATEQIKKFAEEERPFCYKDPRFSYTFHEWYPKLDPTKTVFLCVFRPPASTASSMISFCQEMGKLRRIKIDYIQALQVWECMYSYILNCYSKKGEWLFIHYEQMFDPQFRCSLGKFTCATVNHDLPKPGVSRAGKYTDIPEEIRKQQPEFCQGVEDLYSDLCRRADYQETLRKRVV